MSELFKKQLIKMRARALLEHLKKTFQNNLTQINKAVEFILTGAAQDSAKRIEAVRFEPE